MKPVIVQHGNSPIVMGQPHGGTYVPEGLLARLNERGKGLDDTDWHINRLYEGLLPEASVVQAMFHRYVIDANRNPKGASLYPGQNTTTLCPLTDFDGFSIWQDEEQPDEHEIESRRRDFHAPYHAALAAELARVKQQHGFAILFDCHSIRSNIPFLFDWQLPAFSIGTNGGTTCDPLIEYVTREICAAAAPYDHVINGRFKGGWTTRHYGQPKTSVHAIQMELAQRTYMNETTPWAYRDDLAKEIRPYLARILQKLNSLSLAD